MKWLKEAMGAKGINTDTSINYGSGINYAFPVTQALRIAGGLDGGLTRTNFMLALRSIDMTPRRIEPRLARRGVPRRRR